MLFFTVVRKESLANAKVSTWQRCMYDAP